MLRPAELLTLSQTEHAALFEGCEYAWDALKKLKEYLEKKLQPGLQHRCEGESLIGPLVFIGEGTVVEQGVMIKGPAIIGRNCEIRHNAYIREQVIIGDGCVVGNATEIKHSVLFNQAVAPHFNYVGDSILGWKAHLGAGVKISNVKLMAGNVKVEQGGRVIDSGLRKFGAVIADEADIGCNAVLNPGSVIGRRSIVYANTNWRGVLAENSIAKNRAPIQIDRRSS